MNLLKLISVFISVRLSRSSSYSGCKSYVTWVNWVWKCGRNVRSGYTYMGHSSLSLTEYVTVTSVRWVGGSLQKQAGCLHHGNDVEKGGLGVIWAEAAEKGVCWMSHFKQQMRLQIGEGWRGGGWLEMSSEN